MALSHDDIQKQSIQVTTQYSQILTTLASAIIAGILAFYHNIAQSVQVNLTVLTVALAILVVSIVGGLLAYGQIIYRLDRLLKPQSELTGEGEWAAEEKERKKSLAYQGTTRIWALLQFLAFVAGTSLLVASLF